MRRAIRAAIPRGIAPQQEWSFPSLTVLGLASLLAVLLWGWGLIAPPIEPAIATSAREVQVAQSVEDLQKQRQQIEQQRNSLQQQRNQIENQQNTAENKLDGLKDNIATTAAQISDTEKRLQQAEQRLKALEVELKKAEAAYQTMQQATVARLQFLQRQQDTQGWAVLLQSHDFNEFLDRRYQLKRVYASDRTILIDLKTKADEIKLQRSEVERQKNAVALLRQQLLTQKQEYEAQAEQQETLISRLQKDKSALEAAENQLAQDSENLAVLIRQKMAAQQGIIRGTGRFIYPVAASITSGFGSRVHPILGYRRFHAGVDFGASTGTTIHAADSGRVIFAGWYGGYGRAVIIDHGGGITTMYAHTSRVFVSEGQNVTQGQPIAAVGSTGLSTGPHLHFEVRQNGNPVNPMGYL